MQIKKTYKEVNPELLFKEIREFTEKQGVTLDESELETYSLPNDSSSFITRATLTFNVKNESGSEIECIRAHIVGSARSETKLMLDINEKLFPQQKIEALQNDLDFILSSYEVKPR
jgi:hypothetical protein